MRRIRDSGFGKQVILRRMHSMQTHSFCLAARRPYPI